METRGKGARGEQPSGCSEAKRTLQGERREVYAVPKKIPLRQCVGCREMKEKRALIRVVKSPEGEVSLDFRGKKPGRGAYLCPDPECLKRARKSRALERAFSQALPPEVYEGLEEQMKKGDGEVG